MVIRFGRFRLSDGTRVRVRDTFEPTRRVGDSTYRNVIDASKPKGIVEPFAI